MHQSSLLPSSIRHSTILKYYIIRFNMQLLDLKHAIFQSKIIVRLRHANHRQYVNHQYANHQYFNHQYFNHRYVYHQYSNTILSCNCRFKHADVRPNHAVVGVRHANVRLDMYLLDWTCYCLTLNLLLDLTCKKDQCVNHQLSVRQQFFQSQKISSYCKYFVIVFVTYLSDQCKY